MKIHKNHVKIQKIVQTWKIIFLPCENTSKITQFHVYRPFIFLFRFFYSFFYFLWKFIIENKRFLCVKYTVFLFIIVSIPKLIYRLQFRIPFSAGSTACGLARTRSSSRDWEIPQTYSWRHRNRFRSVAGDSHGRSRRSSHWRRTEFSSYPATPPANISSVLPEPGSSGDPWSRNIGLICRGYLWCSYTNGHHRRGQELGWCRKQKCLLFASTVEHPSDPVAAASEWRMYS